jgi:HEAT repeat protein
VRTTLTIRGENLFNSPPTAQFALSDNLSVAVQPGSEEQLKAVFKPFVTNLDSSDLTQRSEAAAAIITLAPPSLEDVLIKLANTSYGFAAMDALRRANTPKTRDALALNAADNNTLVVRLEAIRNLGRTGDTKYLPMLLELMKSANAQIRGAAAQAAGTLGGAAAVQDVAALVTNADAETRQIGANALGYTHARSAVPVLIGLLLDPNANVRQTAVAGLTVLTHRVVLDGSRWADVTMPQDALFVHQKWTFWWNSHTDSAEIHGMNDCVSPIALN